MKYKLINSVTKKETICDKVTIDGFDYYVSDEIHLGANNVWVATKSRVFKFELHMAVIKNNMPRLVIATNNSNIDIPKVVDEVEQLSEALTSGISDKHDVLFSKMAIKVGYDKSQETHPFSLDDVKEIINLARKQYWDVDNRGFSSNTEGDWSFKYSTEDEIIQKYQEIKVLTIFYE